MPRTTPDAVKAILSAGLDYDTKRNPALEPYIETAASIVDDVVVCATDNDVVISDTKQELLERWLAAHFYKCSDKEQNSRSTAGASASFAGQTGMGLESTRYGQVALSLDSTGCLRQVVEGIAGGIANTVGGVWLGKLPQQQREYGE